MDQQWMGFVDSTNPVMQPMQQLQQLQQGAQKRGYDHNDQNQTDAVKRHRLDPMAYSPSYQQMQQPFPQPMQQLQMPQFPQTPQQPQPMQQSSFTFTPPDPSFGANSPFQGFPYFSMHQSMQPMFPMTSTPIRSNGASAFFTTPSSGDSSGYSSVGRTSLAQTPVRRTHNDDTVIFKEIAGNLSIEGGSKVKITIGELRRRVGAPEYQDVQQMARLTRHTKSSIRDFQTRFALRGFNLNANVGRSQANTILASLIEGEALILARDFTKLISSELSMPVLAAVVVAASGPGIVQWAPSMREHLSCVRANLLSAGREPVELTNMEREDATVDQNLKMFALFTHGFGPLAVLAVIESLIQLMGFIEKSCPTPDQIASAMAPLPLYNQASSSSSNPFTFSSSFNDSGLGTSFQDIPTTPPSLPQTTTRKDDVDLSLLSFHTNNNTPYPHPVSPRIAHDCEHMTIGELRRRALGPEKFTVSLMNSYLRKGKKSNTHGRLREELQKLGIGMKSVKGIKPTSWSSLSENESISLAHATAHYLHSLPHSDEMRKTFAADPNTTGWLRHVAGKIGEAMLGVGEYPVHMAVLTEADLQILRFALISHHFGHYFYAQVMQWLLKVN